MTCNNATHPIHGSMTNDSINIVYHIQYIKFSSYPMLESTEYA